MSYRIQLTENHRKTSTNKVMRMFATAAEAYEHATDKESFNAWVPGKVILVTDIPAADFDLDYHLSEIESVFHALTPSGKDKAYRITPTLSLTAEGMAAREKTYLEGLSGSKCKAIVDGRGRYFFTMLCRFAGIPCEPQYQTVEIESSKDLQDLAYRANAAEDDQQRLAKRDKIERAAYLVYTKEVDKQAGLAAHGFNRGQQQVGWHGAAACIAHGYTPEELAGIRGSTYKLYKAISEATKRADADALIAEHEAELGAGDRIEKVMDGDKIRDLLKRARDLDNTPPDVLALLAAIVSADYATAMIIIRKYDTGE